MGEVTFVDSIQGHQVARLRRLAERLREHRPDLSVTVIEGDSAKEVLGSHRLNFGPAVLIDGRLEYVGVPRWRFLQERIAQVAKGLPNPRSAAPAVKAAPAAAAKEGASPGAPPAAKRPGERA